MNKQEIFNEVATHLFAQGKPALADDCCMYRAPDGNKCAAGCLISDDWYNPEMESLNINAVTDRFKLPKDIFNDENINLIRRLQRVHDDSLISDTKVFKSTERMRKALKDVADANMLDDSILNNLSFKDK